MPRNAMKNRDRGMRFLKENNKSEVIVKIKQLEAFRAIMLLGSTKAAAEHLNMTQSAVSRLLSQLEEEIGLTLFVRSKGRLFSKPEATHLLSNTANVLEQVSDLAAKVDDLKRGRYNHQLIRVAVPYTLAIHFMPRILKEFSQLYPNTVVEILSGDYQYIARLVESGGADFGFIRRTGPVKMEFEKVVESGFVCVLPENHALGKSEALTLSGLKNLPIIFTGRRTALRESVEKMFQALGVRPRIGYEVHSVGVACELVRYGLGISLASELIVKTYNESGLHLVSILEFEPHEYGFVYRANKAISDLERRLLMLMGDALLKVA
ncbi:LysR family transcriptional regulator [Halomonas sp. HNIBRBA4712]|uniref:LysR family transcriptional regulator n=1 Tax=Halomonas sp. HNIBRBA4712 TaxID=3373087 RepID=UPI003745F5DC